MTNGCPQEESRCRLTAVDRRTFLLLLAAGLRGETKQRVWQKATVALVRSKLDNPPPGGMMAGGPAMQARKEYLELEIVPVAYHVERTVVASERLPVARGDEVEIAVEGKVLWLRTANGKEHKFKLVRHHADRP